MARVRKNKQTEGDILLIGQNNHKYCFARVLREPFVAFYDLITDEQPELVTITSAPIAFIIAVMNHAIISGTWSIIGNKTLPEELRQEPLFCKKDAITGNMFIYRDSTGEEYPATQEQCKNLEVAAVWEPDHVEDRLQDYFAGRLNKWEQNLRLS